MALLFALLLPAGADRAEAETYALDCLTEGTSVSGYLPPTYSSVGDRINLSNAKQGTDLRVSYSIPVPFKLSNGQFFYLIT